MFQNLKSKVEKDLSKLSAQLVKCENNETESLKMKSKIQTLSEKMKYFDAQETFLKLL